MSEKNLYKEFKLEEEMKLEKYKGLYEEDEKPLSVLKQIIWLDGDGLILLAVMLLEWCIILVDITYWNINGLIILLSLIALAVTVAIFFRKFPDPDKGKGIVGKAKSDVDFIREIIRKKTLISGITATYCFIFIVVMVLPLVEGCFYIGSFKATIIIYVVTFVAMFLRGLYNR